MWEFAMGSLARVRRAVVESFVPTDVMPDSFRRLVDTVLRFRVVLALTALPLVPFLPATTRQRWVFVGMALFVWIPWAAILVAIAKRQGDRVNMVLPAIGDMVVVLAFHLIVPQLGPVVLYGYLLAFAFYAYLGGLPAGLTITVVSGILLVIGRAAAPPADRLNWFAMYTFVGVLASLSFLMDRASREERRAIAELQALDVAKTEFIANAAHELRTPMATLAGIGQTISVNRSRLTDHQVDELFRALGRQSDRAQHLISNLLDLSRIRAGRLTLDLEVVDVSELIASVLEAAPPPGEVSILTDIQPRMEVMVDRTQVERVLVNLLTNAYRYGGPHVCIEGQSVNGHGEVAVCDDGGGVPDEIVSRLFEPFVRGPEATRQQGSGLGLSIAQHLAVAHGGALRYERGALETRFVVELRSA